MEMADLLYRFNNGDKYAFEQLFKEFLSPLVNFASGLTSSRQEAEDIAMYALNKLWEFHAKFETKENIRAFLYITVRNNCLNYLKANDRKRKAQKEIRYTSGETTCESIENHVHVKISNNDHLHRFHKEVEALPPQCKEVFKLRCAGLNNPQIAEKLNTTIGTVEVQMSRALSILRGKVSEKKLSMPALKFIFSIFFC